MKYEEYVPAVAGELDKATALRFYAKYIQGLLEQSDLLFTSVDLNRLLDLTVEIDNQTHEQPTVAYFYRPIAFDPPVDGDKGPRHTFNQVGIEESFAITSDAPGLNRERAEKCVRYGEFDDDYDTDDEFGAVLSENTIAGEIERGTDEDAKNIVLGYLVRRRSWTFSSTEPGDVIIDRDDVFVYQDSDGIDIEGGAHTVTCPEEFEDPEEVVDLDTFFDLDESELEGLEDDEDEPEEYVFDLDSYEEAFYTETLMFDDLRLIFDALVAMRFIDSQTKLDEEFIYLTPRQ